MSKDVEEDIGGNVDIGRFFSGWPMFTWRLLSSELAGLLVPIVPKKVIARGSFNEELNYWSLTCPYQGKFVPPMMPMMPLSGYLAVDVITNMYLIHACGSFGPRRDAVPLP
jgi:hypothetical protein